MFRSDKSRRHAVLDQAPPWPRESISALGSGPVPEGPPARRKTKKEPAGPPPSETHAMYAVDDFVSMPSEAAAALVATAEADAAANKPACAHLVITCDLRTGVVHHFVPCSTGLEALTLAGQVIDELRAKDPHVAFTLKVTPLLPH